MDIVVTDATASGRETARIVLADVPAPVTLRDLIRFRVREEVVRYHAAPAPRFNGLVRPTDDEAALTEPTRRRLDWEAQVAAALKAFSANGFFVFVDDRQVVDLDEELTLAETDEVRFVKLVPLVGG